jgi:hypothetical protein
VTAGRTGRPGGEPGPTGTPIDDETDRTDLDMDEPFEGLGAGPWHGRDVTRDEALRALAGDEFTLASLEPDGDPTAPRSEGEGGTEEVR